MLRGGNLSRSVQILRADPPLLVKMAIGKLRRLLPLPTSPHIGKVGQINFEFDFSLSPTVSMMYRGTYQPEIRHAIKRLLPRGGVFVDVGANVGFVSAIALDVAGRAGHVLSLEPVPDYFRKLQRLAELNPGFSLRTIQAAASDEDGSASIELNRAGNIGMNSLVGGFISRSEAGITVDVPLIDLARLLEREATRPDLVKIDVEGYEPRVLRALEAFVGRTSSRPAILVEITPSAWVTQRESLDGFEDRWDGLGFSLLDPLSLRPLEHVDRVHQTDVLLRPR